MLEDKILFNLDNLPASDELGRITKLPLHSFFLLKSAILFQSHLICIQIFISILRILVTLCFGDFSTVLTIGTFVQVSKCLLIFLTCFSSLQVLYP